MSSPSCVSVPGAVLPSFVIGSIWYAPPVFGNYWRKVSKLKEKDFENVSFPRQLAITTVMNFIMVTGLAVLMSVAPRQRLEPQALQKDLLPLLLESARELRPLL